MNDAKAADDTESAAALQRPAFGDANPGARVPGRRFRLLAGMSLIVAVALLAACSGTPEERTYDIADRRAEWHDRLASDRRACARRGGVIVRERHRPDSIRIGGREPEAGGRYHCRY